MTSDKTSDKTQDKKSSQTEFDFPANVAGVKRKSKVKSKRNPSARVATRRVLPQTNRLEISPEAFDGPRNAVGGAGGRREGVLEAIAALLATVVFGLGWAAIELERVEFEGSGYDALSATPTSTPPALWNLAAAQPDRRTRTRSLEPEIRPLAARRASSRTGERAEERDDRWTRMDPTLISPTRQEQKAIEPAASESGFGPVGKSSKQ